MVKVSFIAPVYGVAQYLHQFIDSILDQTLTDFELILVDDGSIDGSALICDEYAQKDARIQVIHKINEGVAIARNTGLAVTSGEYVYIVDSDDWLEKDAAQKLYDDAKRTGADCVMSDCVLRYDDGHHLRMQQFSQKFYTEDAATITKIQQYVLCQKYSPYYSNLSSSGYAAPWGKFIKRSVVTENALSFEPYVKGIFDDGLFSLNLFGCIKSFYYNMEHTYNYRIINTSITRKFKTNAIELLHNSFEKIDEYILRANLEDTLRYPFYAHVSRFFLFRLDSYFFDEKNPRTYAQKREEILRVLESKYFKESIENVKLEDLSRSHATAIKFARKKCIWGLKGFVDVRKVYLHLRRR